MSNVLGRLGGLLKSEISSRFSDEESDEGTFEHDEMAREGNDITASFGGKVRHTRVSAEAASRILELPEDALLDEVRATYRTMAQRYHARSVSGTDEQKIAAQGVLDTLTAALESLEEHLLPLAPGASTSDVA